MTATLVGTATATTSIVAVTVSFLQLVAARALTWPLMLLAVPLCRHEGHR